MIPLGTQVMIDGHIYTAEDIGGAVKGKMIDIFVNRPVEKSFKTNVFIKQEEKTNEQRK